MSNEENELPPAISDTAEELAFLMSQDPGGIDKETAKKGANLVGIFTDENFTTKRFPELNERKVEVIKQAIEDISLGVITLRTNSIGLSFNGKKINTYASELGSMPAGTVVFSIAWKNIAAFKNWRKDNKDNTEQEDINSAVYFLTTELAEIFKEYER